MAKIPDKPFSKNWLLSYTLIIIGSFILAAGFVFFITPYKFVPGGVYGIAIVIHYMTQGTFSFAPNGLPVGMIGLVLNIPLTIIGIKILGPRFGAKTKDIRNHIINSMGRGGTYIHGQGMYNGAPRTIIYTVVNRREIIILEEYIHQVDPIAFVTVIEANEILVEGFKSLEDKITS